MASRRPPALHRLLLTVSTVSLFRNDQTAAGTPNSQSSISATLPGLSYSNGSAGAGAGVTGVDGSSSNNNNTGGGAGLLSRGSRNHRASTDTGRDRASTTDVSLVHRLPRLTQSAFDGKFQPKQEAQYRAFTQRLFRPVAIRALSILVLLLFAVAIADFGYSHWKEGVASCCVGVALMVILVVSRHFRVVSLGVVLGMGAVSALLLGRAVLAAQGERWRDYSYVMGAQAILFKASVAALGGLPLTAYLIVSTLDTIAHLCLVLFYHEPASNPVSPIIWSVGLLLMFAMGAQASSLVWRAAYRHLIQLRVSDHHFQFLTQHCQDVLSVHRPDGQFLYSSPACSEMFGRPAHELLGLHPSDIAIEADRRRVRAFFAVQVRNQSKRASHPNNTAPRGWSGRPKSLRIAKQGRKMSSNRHLVSALSEGNLGTSTPSSRTHSFMHDSTNSTPRATAAAATGTTGTTGTADSGVGVESKQVSGRSSAGAPARPGGGDTPPERRDAPDHVSVNMSPFLTTTDSSSIQFTIRLPDGSFREVEMSVKCTATSMVAVTRDVAMQHRYHAEVEARHREMLRIAEVKRTFMQSIFHELRIPLQNIMLGTEELLGAPDLSANLSDEDLELLQVMNDAGASMSQILDDVLMMNKMEQGKFTVDKQPMRIDHLLRIAKTFGAPKAKANGVNLRSFAWAAMSQFGRTTLPLPPTKLDAKPSRTKSAGALVSNGTPTMCIGGIGGGAGGVGVGVGVGVGAGAGGTVIDVPRSPLALDPQAAVPASASQSDPQRTPSGNASAATATAAALVTPSGVRVSPAGSSPKRSLSHGVGATVSPAMPRVQSWTPQRSPPLVAPAQEAALQPSAPAGVNPRLLAFKTAAASDGIGSEVLQLMPAASLPTVMADSRRLGQVLCNFVSNALKFTEPGGEVVVSASVEARTTDSLTLCLAVTDTGPGISVEDQAKLFKPFSQVGAGKAKAHSSGLGLSIVKAIVEEHGGQVGVESTVGIGSCFYCLITLDLYQRPSSEVLSGSYLSSPTTLLSGSPFGSDPNSPSRTSGTPPSRLVVLQMDGRAGAGAGTGAGTGGGIVDCRPSILTSLPALDRGIPSPARVVSSSNTSTSTPNANSNANAGGDARTAETVPVSPHYIPPGPLSPSNGAALDVAPVSPPESSGLMDPVVASGFTDGSSPTVSARSGLSDRSVHRQSLPSSPDNMNTATADDPSLGTIDPSVPVDAVDGVSPSASASVAAVVAAAAASIASAEEDGGDLTAGGAGAGAGAGAVPPGSDAQSPTSPSVKRVAWTSSPSHPHPHPHHMPRGLSSASASAVPASTSPPPPASSSSPSSPPSGLHVRAASMRGLERTLDRSNNPSPLHGIMKSTASMPSIVMSPRTPQFDQCRALIVDDFRTNAVVVARALRRSMSITADITTSPVDALERVRANPDMYNIVFTDNEMPVMDGLELATRLRREVGYTNPIIGVTGHGLLEDIRKFQAAGATHVLTKPVTHEALRHVCSTHLAGGAPEPDQFLLPVPAAAAAAAAGQVPNRVPGVIGEAPSVDEAESDVEEVDASNLVRVTSKYFT